MKKILLALILMLAFAVAHDAHAQTNHNVSTNGLTFVPDSLTINNGDTVTWSPSSGTHNVNGTTVTFPSNPESFTSGAAASSWTFKHVFNTAGVYNYQCDPHARFFMKGKVIVRAATSIQVISQSVIKVSPNPTNDILNIVAESVALRIVKIYGMDGKLVLSNTISQASNSISLKGLAKGIYSIRFEENGKVVHQQRISKI